LAQAGNALQTLTLHGFYAPADEDLPGDGPIHLENLREFSIRGHFLSSRPFLQMLGCIQAPELRRLTIFPEWELFDGPESQVVEDDLEDDYGCVADALLSLIQQSRNLEQIEFGGFSRFTSITLETLRNSCEHVKRLRRMAVAISEEGLIQTLVEFLRMRRDDPQLSEIAELDLVLPASCDNLFSVDEVHVREIFRSEVERFTVKRVGNENSISNRKKKDEEMIDYASISRDEVEMAVVVLEGHFTG